ncbi:MAG: hypothetical protein ABI859_16890 [Pseudomonadota bacterium]
MTARILEARGWKRSAAAPPAAKLLTRLPEIGQEFDFSDDKVPF